MLLRKIIKTGLQTVKSDIIQARTEQRMVNAEVRLCSFTTHVASKSSNPNKSYKKLPRGERQVLVESFVEKFRAANGGKFPGIVLTWREVGGGYYVVRDILMKLKFQAKASSNDNRKVNQGNKGEPVVLSSLVQEQVVTEEFLNSLKSGDCQYVEQPYLNSTKDAEISERDNAVDYKIQQKPLTPDCTRTSEGDQDLSDESATVLDFGAGMREERVISIDVFSNKEQVANVAYSSELSAKSRIPKTEESEIPSEVLHSNVEPCNADDPHDFDMETLNTSENSTSFDMNSTVVDKLLEEPASATVTRLSEIDQDLYDGRILSDGVGIKKERSISLDASAKQEHIVNISNSEVFVDTIPIAEGVTSEAASSKEQSCDIVFTSFEGAESFDVNDVSSVNNDADSFNTNDIIVDQTQQNCPSPSSSTSIEVNKDLRRQSRIVPNTEASAIEAGTFVSSNDVESAGPLHSSQHSTANDCDTSSHKNVKEKSQRDSYQDLISNDSGRCSGGRSDIREAAGTRASVWNNIKSLAGSIMKFWRKL